MNAINAKLRDPHCPGGHSSSSLILLRTVFDNKIKVIKNKEKKEKKTNCRRKTFKTLST